jgi:hypothetical protein
MMVLMMALLRDGGDKDNDDVCCLSLSNYPRSLASASPVEGMAGASSYSQSQDRSFHPATDEWGDNRSR